ncbi:MAG: helix-turn-helix domain-containing protein [Rhodobacteraceae bacterium]|nr:helix-turn-helix domain-containing protein [Paracoccaceae bacterium]
MVETVLNPEQEPFQIKGLKGISHSAKRFLQQHPKHAEQVVVIALETAAGLQSDLTPANDVPDALKPFVVAEPYDSDIISVTEAANLLKVSRTTIYDWINKGKLLAWNNSKRGKKIPTGQILGEGHIVEGIDKVSEIIGNPINTWVFLSNKMPFSDCFACPIDLLKEGRVEEVLGSAAGYGSVPT